MPTDPTSLSGFAPEPQRPAPVAQDPAERQAFRALVASWPWWEGALVREEHHRVPRLVRHQANVHTAPLDAGPDAPRMRDLVERSVPVIVYLHPLDCLCEPALFSTTRPAGSQPGEAA